MIDRDELIADCRLAQSVLCDCSDIDVELQELQQEIKVVTELSKKAIYANANIAIDQQEWDDRNNSYLEQHQKAIERVAELGIAKQEKQNKFLTLDSFIKK